MGFTITFSGSRADVLRLLRQVPYIVSGKAPDPRRLAQLLQLRMGVALLSQIQLDFITKARGGVGKDGIKWPPLSPKTIAYGRRATRTELKNLGIKGRGKRPRPTLTPQQDEQWRKTFARVKYQLLRDLPEREAKRRAAAIAWAEAKANGAKTLMELLGGRQVDILRDTGLLFKSLSPGVDAVPSGAEGQVFKTPPGRVIVGTSQKPWHQAGNKNLPARKLWPDEGIPAAWLPAINRAGQRGLILIILAQLGAQS